MKSPPTTDGNMDITKPCGYINLNVLYFKNNSCERYPEYTFSHIRFRLVHLHDLYIYIKQLYIYNNNYNINN